MASLAIVIGTGPSLVPQIDTIRKLGGQGAKLYGVNNTFRDFDLDCWIATDPDWHKTFSPVAGDFRKYHWSHDVVHRRALA
jgi:hypothetical protein